jgi:DNA topoisomerase IA
MNILIVESKAKCKTLLKHLGQNDWRVFPTGGHVERLPVDRSIHPPKEVKKAYWSNRPGELPTPPWFWTERGEAGSGPNVARLPFKQLRMRPPSTIRSCFI